MESHPTSAEGVQKDCEQPRESFTSEDSQLTDDDWEYNRFIRALDGVLSDIRQRSAEGRITTSRRWGKRSMQPAGDDARMFEEKVLLYIQDHPHGADEPVLGEVSVPAQLPADTSLDEQERLAELEVSDIVLVMGKKAIYLYSNALMSHSFAHALIGIEEDSAQATFIAVIRNESQTYPRPVAATSFAAPPYLWELSRVEQLYDEVSASGVAQDIAQVRTSLGQLFFYSTTYLSEAQGRALAEWYGVEKGRNP